MEVKIKNNNEMIDATIEMVDGVMVVSPKEVKFEPKDGEKYWCPAANTPRFKPWDVVWTSSITSKSRYDKGWFFNTEQECQEFCNRLNEAINNVKP